MTRLSWALFVFFAALVAVFTVVLVSEPLWAHEPIDAAWVSLPPVGQNIAEYVMAFIVFLVAFAVVIVAIKERYSWGWLSLGLFIAGIAGAFHFGYLGAILLICSLVGVYIAIKKPKSFYQDPYRNF